MDKVKIDIYFDGACKNVKDSYKEPFGVGVAVFIDGEYSDVYSKSIWGAEGTSNIAEWTGCIEAFGVAYLLHQIISGEVHTSEPTRVSQPIITIYSDSQLITRQFNGEYQIKEQRFLPYYNESKRVVNLFDKDIKITWVPREQNWVADELSKRALNKDFSTVGANIPYTKPKRYKGTRQVGPPKTQQDGKI